MPHDLPTGTDQHDHGPQKRLDAVDIYNHISHRDLSCEGLSNRQYIDEDIQHFITQNGNTWNFGFFLSQLLCKRISDRGCPEIFKKVAQIIPQLKYPYLFSKMIVGDKFHICKRASVCLVRFFIQLRYQEALLRLLPEGNCHTRDYQKD